jgi:glycosyltransferase involved in cell wall biosynthesis
VEGNGVITVIIPFCPDGGRRDANYFWVTNRIRKLLPDSEILVPIQETLPFNKSAAVNSAVKVAKNDILLICDADMVFNIDLIENSTKIVRDVPWVAPMRERWDLTWQCSTDLLNKPYDIELDGLKCYQKYKEGRCRGGSVFMITKENFYKAGGFDERFIGWGYEDAAFVIAALRTIGGYVETDNLAYHLWHPPAINQYPELTAKNKKLYAELYAEYKEKLKIH